jgi:DNA invertase Pin-like site-specific DNA recombinase
MSRRSLPNQVLGRVALYLRLSIADLKEGESISDGIKRQRKDALEVARQRGLPKTATMALHTDREAGTADVVIYVEDGESAWKRKRVWITDQYGERRQAWRVVRPVWGQMMRDIRGRLYGLAVVYNSDRLARDLYDTEDIIETAQYFGQVWDAATGQFDLSTEDGRSMARFMAVMNQRSSADTARRVARTHREMAESGEPVGGTRPFGWKDDRKTLDRSEADETEAAVKKIRAGMAPTAVLRDWAGRGIVTPRGNTWHYSPFMFMLRNPRLCGYRGRSVETIRDNGSMVHEWEIVKLADGTEVRGKWAPIVSREDWDDLIMKIGVRAEPDGRYGGAGSARYLLSGMVFCGKCGGKMNGNRTIGKGKNTYYYFICPTEIQGGCAANSRSMPSVDTLIEALALRMHAEGASDDEVVGEDENHADEIERIEGLLRDAYAAWKSGDLRSSDYFSMRSDLENDRKAVMAAQARSAGRSSTTGVDEIARRWPDATLDEKRTFIKAYIAAVVVHGIEDVWDEKKKRMVHPTRFNPALIEPVPVRRRPDRGESAVAS